MSSDEYCSVADVAKNPPTFAPIHDLAQSRAKIDSIDEQIIELFQRRMRIVRDVAEHKRVAGKPVFDGVREAHKIEWAQEAADSEFKKYMAPLFDTIMEMSRLYQNDVLGNVRHQHDQAVKPPHSRS